MYVESSSPAQAGDNALLESPWLNPMIGGQCLQFHYNMYGKTTGKLMVHFTENGGAKYLLFYKEGNQGMGWKKFSKSINTALQYRVCYAPSFIWSGASAIRTQKTGRFTCWIRKSCLVAQLNSESYLNAWNPESKFHWQRLESSAWIPESAVWCPKF